MLPPWRRLVQLVLGSMLFGFGMTSALAAGAERQELGFPLLQSFEPSLPEAESQYFDIGVTPSGLLLLANSGGLLSFDGAHWAYLAIGTTRAAFSLGITRDEKIGVGGNDDFGLIEHDEVGSPIYRSLLDRVPASERPLGQVETTPTTRGFLFKSERALWRWENDRLEKLRELKEGRPPARLFKVAEEVYLWTRDEGLLLYGEGGLVAAKGGELFVNRRVDTLLPAPQGLLVSVRGEGLFFLEDGRTRPLAGPVTDWAVKNRIFCGLPLPDGRLVLGSQLDGALLVEGDGTIVQKFHTGSGLNDDFVAGLALDHEGSLWLALDSGLWRAEINSPLTLVDRRSGLPGSVLSVARHQGRLYAGTISGLFVAEKSGTEEPGSPSLRFKNVPGLDMPIWSLLSLDAETLLAGAGFGIYLLEGSAPPRALAGAESLVGYLMMTSTTSKDRIWLGTDGGVGVLERTPEGFVFAGKIAGFPAETVRSMVEKDGVLWCSTDLSGILGIELDAALPEGTPRLQRPSPVLPGLFLTESSGEILAAGYGQSPYRLMPAEKALVPIPELEAFKGRSPLGTFNQHPRGHLFFGTLPPTFALRQGDGWSRQPTALIGVDVRSVSTVLFDADGITWIGTDKGLYRYAGDTRELRGDLPQVGFALITTGDGRKIFGGSPAALPISPILPAQFRRLHFLLSPRSFRAGLRYETRLEPIDADWSRPNPSPDVEITRLPEGNYVLFVRTRGPNGELSPERAFPFQVEPRWTETPLAYLLYLALAGLLASSWAGLRSRALHKRAAELEAKVGQQTAALRRTVEELQKAQDDLEAANRQLAELSSLDALTGIANRRPLQEGLEREWARAKRQGRPLSFLLLDLDHFKALNDSLGHSEGDLCLRRVAQYLKSQLHRQGDLVARYGGEEFAILLPETSREQAAELAEKLRQGIEALAMPSPESPNPVTASFGIATRIPQENLELQDLIDAADAALYLAKKQGRNRVSIAD